MQRDHCPNCNSSYVVPDGRKYGGEPVLYCTNCTSWFLDNGATILFESDGGDDVPDDAPQPENLPADDDERGFSGNPDLPAVQGF